MLNKFKIVKIDIDYCDYLRGFDGRVSYNSGVKELRPFIGILFKINDMEYYAPLASPKEKHQYLTNTLDIVKIAGGKYGVVNFNNMIPVTKNNYTIIDLYKNNVSDAEYKRIRLLKTQLRWLNKNINTVKGKATVLYDLYKKNLLPLNVKSRCCNFILLEEKCEEYNKVVI